MRGPASVREDTSGAQARSYPCRPSHAPCMTEHPLKQTAALFLYICSQKMPVETLYVLV